MPCGVAKLRCVVVAAALSAPAVAAGAAGASVSPALGRWSGSGQGGTISFVVSSVDGTDVFSDLVEQCANGTPSEGDIPWRRNQQGPAFRYEAAIGANGRIYRLFRVPHKVVAAEDYQVHGKLGANRGTVTDFKSGDGDESCVIRDAHVVRTGPGTLIDGDYRVSGGEPGTAPELSVFGEGAEVWWDGLFGTPIGGIEDDPALCAETEATADGVGDVFLGQGGRSFSSHSVSLLGAVAFSGHFTGETHGVGGYLASSFPVCTGAGALTWSLFHAAPPLAPAVPLHERPASTPGPARHHHQRVRTVRYVALGDSFSSGEGVAPYEPGTDTVHDRCHRSTRAYPRLLSRPGTLPGVRLRLSFYACSGATTAKNLLSEPRFGEQPQIDRPLLRRAQLVTLSIGGNDAGFSNVLAACSRAARTPCYRGPTRTRILRGIVGLRDRLAASYEAIHRRTGLHAKVVVVDYPNLFPTRGCAKLRAVFSAKAQAFLRRAGGVLDRTIAQAAAAAGVQFVDVRSAFDGHEVCSRHEWIDFFVAPRAHRLTATMGSFHPNAAGQRAYARVLRSVLEHDFH